MGDHEPRSPRWPAPPRGRFGALVFTLAAAAVLAATFQWAAAAWTDATSAALPVNAGTVDGPAGLGCGPNSPTALDLAWTASPTGGLDGYDIGEATSAAGPFTPIATSVATTATVAYTPGSGITHHAVRAVLGPWTSGWVVVDSAAAGCITVEDWTTTVTFTSDWGAGYCVSVDVTTTSTTPVTWTSVLDLSTFPLNGTVTSSFGANLTYDPLTQTLTATGLAYNDEVTDTSPANWGFCATRPPPPPGPADATVTIDNDWGAGYCATVTVTTTTPPPGITWTVDVDLSTPPVNGTPYTVWNATWSFAAPTLTASGAGFNDVVDNTSPVTFGYCANR